MLHKENIQKQTERSYHRILYHNSRQLKGRITCYPFTPKIDKYLISPNNITPESNIKIRRKKEMKTKS